MRSRKTTGVELAMRNNHLCSTRAKGYTLCIASVQMCVIQMAQFVIEDAVIKGPSACYPAHIYGLAPDYCSVPQYVPVCLMYAF